MTRLWRALIRNGELTWAGMVALIAGTEALFLSVLLCGPVWVATVGIYAFSTAGVCFVAAVMTIRTVTARGWSPRVFLFTWWMWMIGVLLGFLTYRISLNPAPSLDLDSVAVRATVGAATTCLLVVLLTRERRPDGIDRVVGTTFLGRSTNEEAWS